MVLKAIIRQIATDDGKLPLKLKKAGSNLSAHQYIRQTIMITIFTVILLSMILFLIFGSNKLYLFLGILILILFSPLIYKFAFAYIDVQISKFGREIDSDLLFVAEYFLVTLEGGLPLGNSIRRLSLLDRPGGRFFNRIYLDFKTGKDLEIALNDASIYSPSISLKKFLKKLKDSLEIGVDLKSILENFISEFSEKKVIEIQSFSKKLNPIIMIYLLLGIVLPSLGVTFFILFAAIADISSDLLKYILIFIFLLMFGFQYLAFSMFKFSKSTI